MQKFNQLGLELLSTKNEMLNDAYPEVIKKALLFQAESMTENKIIDQDTHLALTNNQLSHKEFTEFLFEKKDYMKSLEELRDEYDLIRETIMERFDTDVIFEGDSDVEHETITFVQTFNIDPDWIKSYFVVKDSDIVPLMKKKGFIAKFAILRIPKIIDEFLDSKSLESEIVSVARADNVYLNEVDVTYGMDMMYTISIEDAENEALHQAIAEYISETSKSSSEYYKNKIS